MELEEFVKNIASAFEKQEGITSQTHFRETEEWCSIIALTIIAIVRRKYKVTLKAEDLRSSITVEDLFMLINKRI